MSLADLKLNTYVPAARVQFAAPISIDRREFLVRSASALLRMSRQTDSLAKASLFAHDVLSPSSGTYEHVPRDDLTPLEKAARRLMMVASCASDGRHAVFTEEEIIALAFYAGCDVTAVLDANDAAFLPIKEIRVERRLDGLIVVFEDGSLAGIVLEPVPHGP